MDSSANDLIGTSGQDGAFDAIEGNVISGNDFAGIFFQAAGADGNVVAGNKIGTDSTGTMAIGNHYDGININVGANGNFIGVNSVYGRRISTRAT